MPTEVRASQARNARNTQSVAEEITQKREQLVALMASRKLSGVLLSRHENVSWASAGQVDMRVAIPAETGAAAVFVRNDGSSYYITTNNEAPRLRDEEFGRLAFDPVIVPWYAADFGASARGLATAGMIASDTPRTGFDSVDLSRLRAQLIDSEIERYRWLGNTTARVVEEVVQHLEPGVSEDEISAQTASLLLQRSIMPSVLLMAVDDRILKYKHALPRGGRLKRFGMVNLCARKWGLVISVTRFVHFGPMPQELSDGFAAAAQVNAALLHATREGATATHLFDIAQQAYAAAGFPGAEQLHHQGGATGYGEREWIATPTSQEVIVNRQAFAWNPSVAGGKVEDTVLLQGGAIEVLTETSQLPVVETKVEGAKYASAGVLLR